MAGVGWGERIAGMANRLVSRAGSAASALARHVAPTDRVIKDLPDWAGFGNQLFYFLWASTQQHQGVNFRLVRSDRSMYWLEHFPLLAAELTIDRSEARLADRRDSTTWRTLSTIDHPLTPSRADVHHFIHTYLMPSGAFDRSDDLTEGLTLNVRRGDYFSDPHVRGLFSFDQIAYVQVVLDARRAHERTLSEIRIVSDDTPWCQARLQHLERHTGSLRFVDSGDPLSDLRTVACSRELIIMNSSFSIWAAYISNYIHGDNHHLIHVPAFGTRPFDGTPWPSIDPRWDIVETIPGGWDS